MFFYKLFLNSSKEFAVFNLSMIDFNSVFSVFNVEISVSNVEISVSNVSIFADSELVVRQINGDYKVKNERMAVLHKKTHELLSKLNSWVINHVLREKNTEADDLSKKGLSK